MADKKDVFEHLNSLENSLNSTLAQVSTIKVEFEKALTENATLRMELEKLRDRLAEIEHKGSDKSEPNTNLIEIYNEGFHVCTVSYGQRRSDDEPCAFCMELLYR